MTTIRYYIMYLNISKRQIQTVTQASGESAIAYLANNKVDIAVVDIMMTGMDGFELCQLLKMIMIYLS